MAWKFEEATSLEEMENELRRCHVPEHLIQEMRTIKGKSVQSSLDVSDKKDKEDTP